MTVDYTYVIGPTLPKSGAVSLKIGHAGDPDKRLGELQTGNPEKLEVLVRWPNKGEFAERTLHQEFASLRAAGGREWFTLPVPVARELVARKHSVSDRQLLFTCSRCKASVVCSHKPNEGGDKCHAIFLLDRECAEARREYEDYAARERAWKESQAALGKSLICVSDMPGFWEHPAPARWKVSCAKCWDDSDEASYWFCTARADTPGKLLHWTSHLMGKSWLKYTDWRHFINKFSYPS